jgi:flagellar assembly protein FliH
MSAARKFLFDLDFAPGAAPPPEAKAERQVPLSELTAAREAAYEAGRADGHGAALLAAETLTAQALDRIAATLATLGAEHAARLDAAERDCARLAAAALAKVLPSLARRGALAEIAALTAACLKEALDEPRVVVRVGDPLFDAVRSQATSIAEAGGYGGKLVVLADDALGPADARVEWAEGGAERDVGRIVRDIEDAARRVLDTSTSPPAPAQEKPE